MNDKTLYFVTFCIGALATRLNMSRNEVYSLLKKGNLVNDYIVPLYDVLHTFSRSYIIDDLTDMMKRKGVLK